MSCWDICGQDSSCWTFFESSMVVCSSFSTRSCLSVSPAPAVFKLSCAAALLARHLAPRHHHLLQYDPCPLRPSGGSGMSTLGRRLPPAVTDRDQTRQLLISRWHNNHGHSAKILQNTPCTIQFQSAGTSREDLWNRKFVVE